MQSNYTNLQIIKDISFKRKFAIEFLYVFKLARLYLHDYIEGKVG